MNCQFASFVVWLFRVTHLRISTVQLPLYGEVLNWVLENQEQNNSSFHSQKRLPLSSANEKLENKKNAWGAGKREWLSRDCFEF